MAVLFDDRFEIISKAKKHIIEATNIEMSPKEMEVLDNFLFRCWQMGWLKNDFHQLEKENAELKKEISVLLSCSDCPENKSGYICEKEYNNKCLAQKIDHIKELNEENAELKAQIEKMKNCSNWKYHTIQDKGAPEDKNKLCVFYDTDGYYINTYNNLSSSDQKNIKKWCYLP